MQKFTDVFNELVLISGINKHQLSKQTGLSSSQVSEFCNGKREPSINNLITIANFFNCTVDYVLGISEENRNANLKTVTSFDFDLFITRLNVAKKNKTINEIAKSTGLPNSIIYDWMNKKHQPSVASLIKLSQVLSVSLDYLIGRKN